MAERRKQSDEKEVTESWVEWGVRRTWGPAIGTVATGDMNRRTAEECAREWPGELVSRVVTAAPWRPVPRPGEPEVGCGECGEPLDPERGLYTGSPAYCKPCSEQVYGDHTRPAAPSCCPGAGSMAHVRGCRNHPEADRG